MGLEQKFLLVSLYNPLQKGFTILKLLGGTCTRTPKGYPQEALAHPSSALPGPRSAVLGGSPPSLRPSDSDGRGVGVRGNGGVSLK